MTQPLQVFNMIVFPISIDMMDQENPEISNTAISTYRIDPMTAHNVAIRVFSVFPSRMGLSDDYVLIFPDCQT